MLATVPLYLGVPGSRYAGHQSRGLVYYFSLVVFLWGQVGDRWIFLSLTRAHKLTVVIGTLRTIVSAWKKGGLCNASSCKRAESTAVISEPPRPPHPTPPLEKAQGVAGRSAHWTVLLRFSSWADVPLVKSEHCGIFFYFLFLWQTFFFFFCKNFGQNSFRGATFKVRAVEVWWSWGTNMQG